MTPSVRRKPSGAALAFAVAVLVLAALLTTTLTLPMLPHSIVEFAVVAGFAWTAIFAGAIALTRSVSRDAGVSDGGEPVAERAEGIPNDPVADDLRLDELAPSAAHLEERAN
jgi:hypothetical protein